eukprot:TRINITY_DN4287_c0_g1_i1.p1 TRINITY_DN4287_c0_g1~~TRINITY_DN4287_c0_g1_i1.p1  ORF type:complete len:271 (+),score=-21.74 TRINITY_DN4287_c0_g1_i1:166-978(+)
MNNLYVKQIKISIFIADILNKKLCFRSLLHPLTTMQQPLRKINRAINIQTRNQKPSQNKQTYLLPQHPNLTSKNLHNLKPNSTLFYQKQNWLERQLTNQANKIKPVIYKKNTKLAKQNFIMEIILQWNQQFVQLDQSLQLQISLSQKKSNLFQNLVIEIEDIKNMILYFSYFLKIKSNFHSSSNIISLLTVTIQCLTQYWYFLKIFLELQISVIKSSTELIQLNKIHFQLYKLEQYRTVKTIPNFQKLQILSQYCLEKKDCTLVKHQLKK